LRYSDPRLAIQWPLPVTDLSDKDSTWPLLDDAEPAIHERMALGAAPLAAGSHRRTW
jgi:dTDP-4-dehydrorhamnose 3,5-epimerase